MGDDQQKVTREQALRVARQLGCRGAHDDKNGNWMPCESMEEFRAIRKGENEYLKFRARAQAKPSVKVVHSSLKQMSKTPTYFVSREMAQEESLRQGCSGVRVVFLGGRTFYAPCIERAKKRPKTDGWEGLGERPIRGIGNTGDGGLVSIKSNGFVGELDDVRDISKKGFVNFVGRSTDPDVYTDPASARIRSRNLGCIGIRRYTASDGKTVWLPCSNGSDYNKYTGVRGDGSPKKNPRSSGKKSTRLSLGLGDAVRQKSAARKPNAPNKKRKHPPILDSDVINDLAVLIRSHNAKYDADFRRSNLRDLKTVYTRGLDDGDAKDAKKRVLQYLSLLGSDKPSDLKYRKDNDLLHIDHPWLSIEPNFKDDFSEGVYGVKVAGCCPAVVLRHTALSI